MQNFEMHTFCRLFEKKNLTNMGLFGMIVLDDRSIQNRHFERNKLMKKFLAIILALTLLISLASCSRFNPFGKNEEEEQEPLKVKVPYTSSKVVSSLESMRNDGGFLIQMTMTSSGTGMESETENVIFAQTERRLYFRSATLEGIIDFYSVDEAHVYIKNEKKQWEKTTYWYDNLGTTHQTVEEEYRNHVQPLIDCLKAHSMIEGQLLEKRESFVAGRACDQYIMKQQVFGMSAEVSFSIDKETGICLEMDTNAGIGSLGSASTTFTCTRYEHPFTIELPTNYIDATEESDPETDPSNEGH